MDVLMDTHAILWFFKDDKRLSKTAVDIIYNLDNRIYVSIASVWEFAIKLSTAKLSFDGGIDKFVDTIYDNEFELLNLSLGHTKLIANLPFIHRDPFDRMIIAQAMLESMMIITIDENISKYDVGVIW